MPNKLKLPLSKVNEFLDLASRLSKTTYDHLSTAEYLKLEVIFGECFLTKNDTQAFIVYKFDLPSALEDCAFLINEDKLRNFVSSLGANSTTLYVYEDDFTNDTTKDITKEIRISDSEKFRDSKKLGYNTSIVRISDFPNSDFAQGNYIRMDRSLLIAINSASKFTSTDNLKPHWTCVYVGNHVNNEMEDGKFVFASDMHSVYIKELTVSMSALVVKPLEAKVLNGLSELQVSYAVNDSHNIYSVNGGNILFGFRHIDNTKGFSFSQFISAIKKEIYFSINVEDILLFCQRAKSSSSKNSNFINSNLRVDFEAKEAILCYNDREANDEDIKTCSLGLIVGEMESFNLNHNQWYDILKALPYQVIHISDEKHFLGVTTPEDNKYIGLISKIQAS